MNLFMASRASGIFSLLEFLLDIVVFSFRFVGRCLPRPVGYRRHSMCGEKTNMLKGAVVIFAAPVGERLAAGGQEHQPSANGGGKGNFYLTNRGCSCMVNPTEKNKYVDREKVAFQCCRELPLRCEAVRREADVTGPRVAFLSRRFGV